MRSVLTWILECVAIRKAICRVFDNINIFLFGLFFTFCSVGLVCLMFFVVRLMCFVFNSFYMCGSVFMCYLYMPVNVFLFTFSLVYFCVCVSPKLRLLSYSANEWVRWGNDMTGLFKSG